jgi:hypothetical protein
LGLAGQTGSSQPDQIRVFDADGSSQLIAQDVNSSPGAAYTGFDSSRPAILDDGRVAFIANLATGGRGVFLSDGSTTLTIATTSTRGVSEIDFFPPAANNLGHVAFRGKDENGLHAVFVGDGVELRRVIGEHDLIPTDLGVGRIDQHDSSVPFGGSISINEQDDIVFQCALTPRDDNQVEWGSGLYIAFADIEAEPGDANGDGVVNVDDLLAVINSWGNCPTPPANCPTDFDDNGVVNVDDLLIVINNWG